MQTRVVFSILLAMLAAASAQAGVDPADSCKDAKAKAVGKKAADLLKAYGKNLKKSDSARLAAGVSKAQSKLTKAFVKAEGKGGCATTGDAAAMESKVAALSDFVLECMGPTCGNGLRASPEECDAGPPDGAGPSPDCAGGTCIAGCYCP